MQTNPARVHPGASAVARGGPGRDHYISSLEVIDTFNSFNWGDEPQTVRLSLTRIGAAEVSLDAQIGQDAVSNLLFDTFDPHFSFDMVSFFFDNRAFVDSSGAMLLDNVSVILNPDDPPPLLPGDANRDGRVDGEDFLIWQANFTTQEGATWDDGDFNDDGRVDGEDFLIWQANFGTVAGSSAVTPEPAALALLGLSGVLLLRRTA